jgi:hypothetical protein
MTPLLRNGLDPDLTLTSARLAAVRFRSVLASRADADDGPLLLSDAPQWAAQVASLEPAARAELAMMISDPARCVGELDRRAMATLDGLDMATRRKLSAIVAESPPSSLANDVAGFLSATFGPPPAVTAPAEARTDRQDLEEVVRLDSAAKPEEDDMTDEDRLKKARRTGRTEANRALREILAGTALEDAEDDDELDESGTSGTDEDDQSGTRTDAGNGNTMSNRRDDIHALSTPRSPGEHRAARERLTRSVADEVRESHRVDALDVDPEAIDRAVERDPGVRAAHATEDAAQGAMQRRAMSVGRTPTTRTDTREQPRGTFSSPAAQRQRLGIKDGDEGPAAA